MPTKPLVRTFGGRMADGSESGSFEIHRESRGDTLQITPVGELDIATAPALAAALTAAERSPVGSVVLDLTEVTFLDSAGVRMLLAAAADSRANAGRLRIRESYAPQVRRVLEVTGVIELLTGR